MKSILTGVLLLTLAACSQTNSGDAGTQTDTAPTATTASDNAQATPPASASTEPQEKPMSAYENKIVELHTTAGQINLRFFPDIAPNHVKNFIDLSEQGFYNGTKFHRVIPGFVIQGGDPNTVSGNPATWGTGGSPKNVKAEFSPRPHKRGILSMARSGHPDSASSQFFICVADVQSLDNAYTVFGEVTQGMDVVDTIVNAPRLPGDRPENPTTITKAVVRDATDAEKQ
ncbi:MAG TPA: peptidylprolyl isomerase [Thermoanaerobaculia bacterium]